MKKTGLFELNAVMAVASHRNFRAAAVELGLSPSALSHAVAVLEQRLGVRLFNRTTRSVALTPAGEQFLARIAPAVQEIGAAMEAVNDFRDTPTGTLRINSSEGAARQVMAPVVLEFLRRYPDMRVEIVTDGQLGDIVAAGFDAGIRLRESVPQDMIAVPIGPDQRFIVVGAPGYFAGRPKPLSPHDLAGHDCIQAKLPSGAPFRWEFEKHGEEIVLDPTSRLVTDHYALTFEAALAGFGLAYVNVWAATPHLQSGALVSVLDDWCSSFPGLCLYYPGHRHVPAGLKALVAVAREIAAKA